MDEEAMDRYVDPRRYGSLDQGDEEDDLLHVKEPLDLSDSHYASSIHPSSFDFHVPLGFGLETPVSTTSVPTLSKQSIHADDEGGDDDDDDVKKDQEARLLQCLNATIDRIDRLEASVRAIAPPTFSHYHPELSTMQSYLYSKAESFGNYFIVQPFEASRNSNFVMRMRQRALNMRRRNSSTWSILLTIINVSICNDDKNSLRSCAEPFPSI